MLRDNNRKTELECDHLIKSLREIYLEPVFSDLRDPDCSDFVVMEERLRSAYEKIEIEFSKQAPRSSLSSNCGYVYERVMIAFDVYLIDHSPLRLFMTTVKSEIVLYVYIIDHPLTPHKVFMATGSETSYSNRLHRSRISTNRRQTNWQIECTSAPE